MKDFRYHAHVFILLIILSFAIALCACASTLTDEDREYNQMVDRNNWATCVLVYNYLGMPTWHFEHVHRRGHVTKPWMVRSDLSNNQCRLVIKRKYWEDHIK